MIAETGIIQSHNDIYKLNIVDFNRLNGYWGHQGEAMETIFSWLSQGVFYSRCNIDLSKANRRLDWETWDHVGSHDEIGQMYWNWFYGEHPSSELCFSDSPDFYGRLLDRGAKPQRFWGDIGEVSASAFAMTIKQMDQGDLWISVFPKHQVILEFAYSPIKVYNAMGPWLKDMEVVEIDISEMIVTQLKQYSKKSSRKRTQRTTL